MIPRMIAVFALRRVPLRQIPETFAKLIDEDAQQGARGMRGLKWAPEKLTKDSVPRGCEIFAKAFKNAERYSKRRGSTKVRFGFCALKKRARMSCCRPFGSSQRDCRAQNARGHLLDRIWKDQII